MKHTFALLAAVATLALLAALRTESAPRAPRRASVSLPPAPSLPLVARELAAERHSYDFSVEQEVLIEGFEENGLEIPELALRSRLTGRLLVRELPGALGLEAADVEHEGVEGADARELMRGEVLLRGDEVSLPEAMDARGRLLWRRLLLLWPGRLEAGTREEADPTGLAVVTYERLSADVWLRRKVSYREIRTSGRAFRGEVAVGGETRIEMDGLPLRVEGEETVALKPAQGPAMRSAARFRLVRTGSEPFEGQAATPGGLFEPLVVAPRKLVPRMEPAVARERARACVARLKGTDDPSAPEHHDALMDLVEALEGSDAAVEEIMEILRAGAADDRRAQELVVALAASGTDAAQAGLVEVLRGEGHLARLRQAAVAASVQVEEPREGIDKALAAFLGAPDEGCALCALAAVGHRVREAPERFRAIQRTVLRRLEAASDPKALSVALEAIGNLGPDEVPEAVKLAATHEDREVRRAAARSLLRVRDPLADRLLATLLGDGDAPVRAAALDTLVRRDRAGLLNAEPLPAPLPDLLEGIARNDEDAGVRDFARSLGAL